MYKEVYFCPVEGVVTKNDIHSFKYEIVKSGDKIAIKVINYNYMVNKPNISMYFTNKDEIINLCLKGVNDDYIVPINKKELNSLINKLPDFFIETIVFILNRYKI